MARIEHERCLRQCHNGCWLAAASNLICIATCRGKKGEHERGRERPCAFTNRESKLPRGRRREALSLRSSLCHGPRRRRNEKAPKSACSQHKRPRSLPATSPRLFMSMSRGQSALANLEIEALARFRIQPELGNCGATAKQIAPDARPAPTRADVPNPSARSHACAQARERALPHTNRRVGSSDRTRPWAVCHCARCEAFPPGRQRRTTRRATLRRRHLLMEACAFHPERRNAYSMEDLSLCIQRPPRSEEFLPRRKHH